MRSTKCGFDDGKEISGSQLLALNGPTLFVDIGFDSSFNPAGPTAPNLAATRLWALVDTGATECCVDDDLAQNLALPIVDRKKIAGSRGVHEVNMYLAHIHVPSLQFTMYGAFAGVNLRAGGQRHFALIGRTFLRNFTMTYEGATGTVTISKK